MSADDVSFLAQGTYKGMPSRPFLKGITHHPSLASAMLFAMASVVECNCCYESVELVFSVCCSSMTPHFFCFGCMNRHFGVLMDKQSVEMGCIYVGTCAGSFEEYDVFRFMDGKALQRYSDISQRSDVRKAMGLSLVQCSLCGTEYVDERSDKTVGISCPNVECLGIGCLKCKRKLHPGEGCESRDWKRIAEEERATYSVVKVCFGCNVDLYRDGGCNHVTCSCGVITCYVCGNDITREGYSHGCVLFGTPRDREERKFRGNHWDAEGVRYNV